MKPFGEDGADAGHTGVEVGGERVGRGAKAARQQREIAGRDDILWTIEQQAQAERRPRGTPRIARPGPVPTDGDSIPTISFRWTSITGRIVQDPPQEIAPRKPAAPRMLSRLWGCWRR